MKAYDYWLADKYIEHIDDAYILSLLKNKRELDSITDELDLHMTYRQLIINDFKSRANQFKDYPGMSAHMLMLSEYIRNNQEEMAVKAIEIKAREMRQIILATHRSDWRHR
jgi:hypothetical protein